ncbi:CSC1-like protein RXW8 isoform X1 [Iris pallida]|uniref:CSC1-like protein RXW8 isoform X1 n=1 Tax=Iris pallida TaxID=29817 RepID=A0AAX6I2A2_IRIPA|nr:CSC1-like protein RXW8 isoform X1 [Iris pallida]
MNVSALLTSAGINIGICALLLFLCSLLRKQPGNVSVYFGRRLAQEHSRMLDSGPLDRLVPSASWLVKAWETSEEDLLGVAGLDAVVFIRMLVFSIRVFSIAAVVCLFGVLPANYYGQDMHHRKISSLSLDVFTIGNVDPGSRWLWVHCLSLYIISCSACVLLYFEYRSIARMRLIHITRSPPSPSHFTVLVRAIPWSVEEPYDDAVKNFFSKYHASTYLSHQMIYRVGKVQKLMNGAEEVYKKICLQATAIELTCRPSKYTCGLCGGKLESVRYHNDFELTAKKLDLNHSDLSTKLKECASAFVFFKSRYAALVASQVLQSSNPMLWVTDLAPEPHDIYWSNLWIPYRQLWFRRIATLLASIVFMFLFLIPVTFVQGLTQLDQLQQRLPFLKGILKKKFMIQIVTGYLPSVILLLFLYTVPPLMMLFSTLEGSISHSGRKKSACYKVLYFNIWNVFFVNVLSGSIIKQLNVISTPKGIPTELAKAVPSQATFFITYVLTSGWASLSSEVVQLFSLIWNFIRRHILRRKDDPDSAPSFPYHTEVPRVLVFGLLGFTCAILAPLIIPFLLVYFVLGYVVYRNQVLNVYIPKYETGGQMWPMMHNTTIFSLVLSQIINLGVFGIKRSPVASGFTIPLVICTLLFNEYCRKRFHPVFQNLSAQELIDMDEQDEKCGGRMEEIHKQLLMAYCQFSPPETTDESCRDVGPIGIDIDGESENRVDPKEIETELEHPTLPGLPISSLQQSVKSLTRLVTVDSRKPSM